MASKNRFYPHLLPEDIEIWERFLESYRSRFERFDYDVRVGEGRPTDATHPQNIQQMAKDLSQKRIDAVGYTDDAIMIIEVTKYAGLKAIGQLIAYPILYVQTYPTTKPVLPLLVTAQLAPDTIPVLNQHRIPYYVV